MQKRAIALGADSGYISKLETTIKSICCYNDNLKFYIFNDDLPSEWFLMMNKRLKSIQCEILDIKSRSYIKKISSSYFLFILCSILSLLYSKFCIRK